MQNLTTHYNILYNANELLRLKQEAYAISSLDQYGDILSVYQDTITHTDAADKDLEAVITKANTIISEKEQSKYGGDAYLLLGKANFLDGKFFNAVEFFSYVIRSYPADFKLTQEAAAWKVRGLLYLNNYKEAKETLDSAFVNPDSTKYKHFSGAVYAAALQYDIKTQNYADGIAAANNAIAYADTKLQKLRWTFILAQLQELNNQNADALANYKSLAKSNASFEMAFNAELNRIRIEEMHNGVKVNRVTVLLSLLKDENNNEFNDQIYYQVAQLYAADKDVDNALQYYKLSAAKSLKNQNQKGLAYLRIADINFNTNGDYVAAKNYYDSTLLVLATTYPGYQAIKKKGENLQLLVDQFEIIAHEDTLQLLAKMDEPTRLKTMDDMVDARILQQKVSIANSTAAVLATALANAGGPTSGNPTTGNNFYFYNAAAVSKGLNEFKRRWGNRNLEDDWRRSRQTAVANVVGGSPASAGAADPDAVPGDLRKSSTDIAAGNYRQSLLQNLPLTPVLMAQSNTRTYNAYLEIANFYRDVLEDKNEAIINYELLLTKYPEDRGKAPIYYSLYRLYADKNQAKSTEYKNRLLKEFPETLYAKVIIDPDYSKKISDSDAQFNEAYNKVYALYSQRQYSQVITQTDALLQSYPGNKMLSQIYYLRAIANGHLQKVEPFRAELQQIVSTYPNDELVTPLVKEHLAYVDANNIQLATQTVAITDTDTSGLYFSPPVEYQKDAVLNRGRTFAAVQVIQTPVTKPVEKPGAIPIPPPVIKPAAPAGKDSVVNNNVVAAPPVTKPVDVTAPGQEPQVVIPPKRTVSNLFNERDSTDYYFVVNVNTGTTDLSSSRFGIGQFNRTKYQGQNIAHKLKNAGPDNQLIYVGRLTSLAAAKAYARNIIPLMPQIMKLPADKYSFFIITQENLDKLAGQKLLDEYIYYYQQILLNQ
ncbi:tol-pal system YbgF family protein [Mucilaginibacter antarcticus]|uniref:Tol-pal system YbgF family protein n=2 Tax=Mucilaginibacter antarcticus TaxID=1855725 RepID=A0ABW5XPL2_9SPHI